MTHTTRIPLISEAFNAVVAAEKPSAENGGPCATCAFRAGTEAHETWWTVELARLCVEGLRPFQCHEQPQLCRGWIAAVNLRGVPADEDARRACEVAGAAADILAQCIEVGRLADEAARQP